MEGRKSGRVKVVERLGSSLLDSLENQVPWMEDPCDRPGCKPCQSKPGSCLKANITYQIICRHCKSQGKEAYYWGESHRTWWDRSQDHIAALRTSNESYAVVKHMKNEHPNTHNIKRLPEVTKKYSSYIKVKSLYHYPLKIITRSWCNKKNKTIGLNNYHPENQKVS